MDEKIPSLPAAEPPLFPVHGPRSPLSTAFFNERGLRAGWRIVIYLFLVFLLGSGVNLFLAHFIPRPATPSAPPMWLMTLQEGLSFAIVFLPAWFMSRVERRDLGDYGLPGRQFLAARFWQGCVLGILEISALIGCIAASGGYRFGSLNLHGSNILRWLFLWLFFFLLVGLFEEFAFRGYLQFTLADGIGFWPAAWILSLGFGAVHLKNRGEGWVGAAAVATIALIFALALKRTGNLWLVVGWHAAFDFGETFLFSVPNSGNVFEGHLSNAALQGPIWLTGGTVGPEGSVFSFLTMGIAAIFIHKAFPARQIAVVAARIPANASASQRTSSDTSTS